MASTAELDPGLLEDTLPTPPPWGPPEDPAPLQELPTAAYVPLCVASFAGGFAAGICAAAVIVYAALVNA
jgi:hypothetical protein